MICEAKNQDRSEMKSGFPGLYRRPTPGVTSGADFTHGSVTAPRRAMFSTVIDDLQMKIIPPGFRKEIFEISFGLNHGNTGGQSPPLGKAVNVGVHRKRRYAKGLGQDHGGGFMPYSRERFQILRGCRYAAVMLFHQKPGQL